LQEQKNQKQRSHDARGADEPELQIDRQKIRSRFADSCRHYFDNPEQNGDFRNLVQHAYLIVTWQRFHQGFSCNC
jgi:hypothetical protein